MADRVRAVWGSRLAILAIAVITGSTLAGCRFTDEKTEREPAAGDASGGSGNTPTPPPTSGVNRAPTIRGTPATTAKIGVPYVFQPTASDPDGDRLTFEIRSKPDWAKFNTATGKLEGTPAEGTAGTFTGVQIVVSDGKTSASLDPFSIAVVEPTVGSAELVWEAPSLNVDGSPLTDLAGYVIRYGRSASALDRSVRIDNAGTTTYVIENLAEGTWYFSLSSLNSSGAESRPTGFVTTRIG
jgi:hypothetical protein